MTAVSVEDMIKAFSSINASVKDLIEIFSSINVNEADHEKFNITNLPDLPNADDILEFISTEAVIHS